jgi:hypothetical protein
LAPVEHACTAQRRITLFFRFRFKRGVDDITAIDQRVKAKNKLGETRLWIRLAAVSSQKNIGE